MRLSARLAYGRNLQDYSDMQGHLFRLRNYSHGDCMEIGVRTGVSTSAILAGIEEVSGHLWSFDVNDCPVFGGHPDWTFSKLDSIKESEKVKSVIPETLQMLLIDGDHTYEGALSDLENYAPRAKVVFVHDTECPLTYPGVRRAVEKFVKHSGRSVAWHPESFGMAEIR